MDSIDKLFAIPVGSQDVVGHCAYCDADVIGTRYDENRVGVKCGCAPEQIAARVKPVLAAIDSMWN